MFKNKHHKKVTNGHIYSAAKVWKKLKKSNLRVHYGLPLMVQPPVDTPV